MRGAEAAYRLHLTEEVIEHVAPVAEHVEDDAAAVLAAVVPRRPLRRLPVALEHPVAELAPDRQHPPEEAAVAQHGELPQARQEQLVLHHAVLDPRVLRLARQGDGLLQAVGDRLLAVDVLAGVDRAAQQPAAHLRGAGIEEQRVVRVGQRRVEVVAPALDAVGAGHLLDLGGVAPDQDRVRHQPVTVPELDPALAADRRDRAHQVLVVAHAPGDPVHDETELAQGHLSPSLPRRSRNACA